MHVHNSSVHIQLLSLLFRSLPLIVLFCFPVCPVPYIAAFFLLSVVFYFCIHLCISQHLHVALEIQLFLRSYSARFHSFLLLFLHDLNIFLFLLQVYSKFPAFY